MKKRFLSVLLALTMLLALLPGTALAATGDSQQMLKAKALYEMGLFKGYDSSGTNFGLADAVTREQALIFLIRLLGEDAAALAWKGEGPYTDVQAGNWVLSYVGYAKEKGYTKGKGNNLFGVGDKAGLQEMCTFVLRGLGYSDAASVGDFAWNTSVTYAQSKKLVEDGHINASFTRGVAVEILYNAVNSNLKGQSQTLAAKLIQDGVMTQAQYDKGMAVVNGTQDVVLADGIYTMSCMGKYLRVSSGKLELRDTTPPQAFTVVNKSGYINIMTEDGKYLGLSGASSPKDGDQLAAGSTAYAWTIKKESGGYSIYPQSKPGMVVNASGVSSANGTKMIVWTGSGSAANSQITFAAAQTYVTGVTLDQTAAELAVGQTLRLSEAVSPANAANKAVTWSTDAPGVATVDQSGVVTGVKVGTAIITVKTTDGAKTATCKVTVTAASKPVTGVSLNKTTVSLTVGQTETLTATVAPTDALNKAVTWSSDATAVATVENGVVKGVAAGTATITVKTTDSGKTASCTVMVTADTSAASKALKARYDAAVLRYNKQVDESKKLDLSAAPDLVAQMNQATNTVNDLGIKINASNLTTDQITQYNKSLDNLDGLMRAIDELIAEASKPKSREIQVCFVNNTGGVLEKFKFSGHGYNVPVELPLLIDGGLGPYLLTVPAPDSAFTVTVTDYTDKQEYTLSIVFDKSVTNRDGLDVVFTKENGKVVYQQVPWKR